MVSLLIMVIVLGLIFWLIYWAIEQVPIPAPFNVVVLLSLLLGGFPVHTRLLE